MSPLPEKIQETMDFPEAMRELIAKKRVTKLEWKDEEFYVFLNEGKLQLHKPDGNNYDWIISEGDLNGDDFTVIL